MTLDFLQEFLLFSATPPPMMAKSAGRGNVTGKKVSTPWLGDTTVKHIGHADTTAFHRVVPV